MLKPLNDIDTTQGVEIGEESSTTLYQEHVACSFAYKIVSCVNADFTQPLVLYRGEDAAENFVRDLRHEAKELCSSYIKTPKPMIFSVKDSLAYTNATECHICAKQLGDDSVRDHCHITGIYHGAAHSMCNLPEPNKLEVASYNT